MIALPLGKIPWYPLARRLGGPQNQYGRCREDKTLASTGNLTATPHSPAYSQALYQQQYPTINVHAMYSENWSVRKLKC
jgi:hypothetical protein